MLLNFSFQNDVPLIPQICFGFLDSEPISKLTTYESYSRQHHPKTLNSHIVMTVI